MPNSEIVSAAQFSYTDLDRETQEFLKERTEEMHFLMERTAQDIIRIGQILIEVKKKLGHGNYIRWLNEEFQEDYRMAHHYMRVAETFKPETVSDLKLARSALYLLAAPSTPEAARIEALERASAGENITKKTAIKLRQKYLEKGEKRELKSSQTSPVDEQKAPLAIQQKAFLEERPSTQLQLPISQGKIIAELKGEPPQILALRPQEKWWKLGEHWLCCGWPDSPRFQSKLPSNISLSLAFPPSREGWSIPLNLEAQSIISLHSKYPYQELDAKVFQDLIKCALELYTREDEAVVFYFLPQPWLPIGIDELGCKGFFIEPDFTKCERAIIAWKQLGKKVEKIEELDQQKKFNG